MVILYETHMTSTKKTCEKALKVVDRVIRKEEAPKNKHEGH